LADPAQGPQGDSWATVTIDRAGNASLSGMLADNTPFALKAPLTKDGRWPLYVPLYAGKGSLWGWVTMTNDVAQDLTAPISWSRPALAGAPYYAAGFATNTFTLTGSRFVPPVPATANVVDFTDGQVEFRDGNISPPWVNNVTLLANNKVMNNGPGTMTLTLTPANGLFGGTATLSGLPKPVPFKGVLLQRVNQGTGFFLGTNQSGRVHLEPNL
jgi:hypothetical protein